MPKKLLKRHSDWMIVRWMLILRPSIVTATLGFAMLILPQGVINKMPLIIVVFGTYILTFLYWFTHRISVISRSLLATQIAFDIFIITVIIHYTGGYESSFVGFYLLSIMCASLFFKKIVTFLIATQGVLFYTLYLFILGPQLDSSLKIAEEMRVSVIYQAVLYSTLMYGFGWFSSYYSEKLRGKDTALTNALKLLKEARLDTSDILQSMRNGLITIDKTGRIMYMNRVAEEILQVNQVVAVGKTYTDVFSERAEELVKIFDKQLVNTSQILEREINVLDGKGSVIPLGLTSMPIYDTDGSRRGAMLNFKDLTEKIKLLEMIRQSERMAAVGELSAAIAHEIRNPLASIYNAAEILSESLEKKDPQKAKLINVIEKESDRLHRISSDFLQFARIKNPEANHVKLKHVVEDVLTLIENDPQKTKDIKIINTIDKNVTVFFDVDQLNQLILNIIINSLEVLDGRGEIEIKVDSTFNSSKKFLRIIFIDDGPGFPEEALGHMFEPFFSTKKNGTGLGLALVRKIVIANHGRVFARNCEEGGAEIVLDMLVNGVE